MSNNAYETSATVEGQGQVRVAGVPFAAGTQVDVIIRRKQETTTAAEQVSAAAIERMRELFGTVKGFRNSPKIPREDLFERGSLR
jgi:hypothetical protein